MNALSLDGFYLPHLHLLIPSASLIISTSTLPQEEGWDAF
jgi:hypothetical protein